MLGNSGTHSRKCTGGPRELSGTSQDIGRECYVNALQPGTSHRESENWALVANKLRCLSVHIPHHAGPRNNRRCREDLGGMWRTTGHNKGDHLASMPMRNVHSYLPQQQTRTREEGKPSHRGLPHTKPRSHCCNVMAQANTPYND